MQHVYTDLCIKVWLMWRQIFKYKNFVGKGAVCKSQMDRFLGIYICFEKVGGYVNILNMIADSECNPQK